MEEHHFSILNPISIQYFAYFSFLQINVEGLKNVLQACKENETIQKIIYTSSFFALGCTDGYVADENQVNIFITFISVILHLLSSSLYCCYLFISRFLFIQFAV